MSGYYYSREAGAEGQILTGEGTAPGVGLDLLLERERPPLRVALAIGSAIADVLCIAAEDGLVHGDIRPAHVRVDPRGTVSVEGYGVQRRTTRAPEGRPDARPADVYGLGVVLHSILSVEPLGQLPKDPDGHDDAVVSRVLAMDFREVQGKRWLEDVRRFLCQILAWSPADRPEPLDAANVLASVASQCPGETLEAWAARATSAPEAKAPAPRPRAEEEDLGGPVALSGPLAKGGVRQAPAAKGESTAFWSREKIAAMLAEDDEDDAPAPPPRRQTVQVPSARTSDGLRAPEPRAAAPRPPEPRAEPPRAEPRPDPRAERPAEPTFRVEPVRSEVQKPASSPFAGAQVVASDPLDDAPPKKTSPLVWVAIAGVVLAILCGVLTLGGGGAWYFMGGSPEDAKKAAEEATAKAEADAEAARKKAEAEAKEAADATDGAGSAGSASADGSTPPPTAGAGTTATGSPAPSASTSTSPKSPSTPPKSTSTAPRSTSTPPKSTSAPKPPSTPPKSASPAPAPASAGFSVKFSAPGREAKLQCGDGQTAEFASATTLSFVGTTTCLVRIDQGKGAVQVNRTTTVICSEDAGKVTCTGA